MSLSDTIATGRYGAPKVTSTQAMARASSATCGYPQAQHHGDQQRQRTVSSGIDSTSFASRRALRSPISVLTFESDGGVPDTGLVATTDDVVDGDVEDLVEGTRRMYTASRGPVCLTSVGELDETYDATERQRGDDARGM